MSVVSLITLTSSCYLTWIVDLQILVFEREKHHVIYSGLSNWFLSAASLERSPSALHLHDFPTAAVTGHTMPSQLSRVGTKTQIILFKRTWYVLYLLIE